MIKQLDLAGGEPVLVKGRGCEKQLRMVKTLSLYVNLELVTLTVRFIRDKYDPAHTRDVALLREWEARQEQLEKYLDLMGY